MSIVTPFFHTKFDLKWSKFFGWAYAPMHSQNLKFAQNFGWTLLKGEIILASYQNKKSDLALIMNWTQDSSDLRS